MKTAWPLLLLLTIKADDDDFAKENCKEAEVWESLPFPVMDQPGTVFPGGYKCTKNYESGWAVSRCKVEEPLTYVDYRKDTLFNHNAQVYLLECFKWKRPKVTTAGDGFARWVLANAEDRMYGVPVANVAGASVRILFTKNYSDDNETDGCTPFGGMSPPVKAGKTGIFVKNGAAYTMQCLKKAAPKLQRVENFANEICNGKKKKAEVQVTGKNSPIPSVCVSFSCSESKQISKCNPDCKTFGGSSDVSDKPISFAKDGKSYEATCTKDGLPHVVYKDT